MKTPNPEHIDELVRAINAAPYFQLLHMRVLDMGLGFAVVEIDLASRHLQPYGIVHGGVLASLIESATSWAVFYGIEDEGAGVTTVDLKLNYLAPATPGKAIAKGRQIKLGRTLAYADAEVSTEDGRLLAHGTSTLMILAGKAPHISPASPNKFV